MNRRGFLGSLAAAVVAVTIDVLPSVAPWKTETMGGMREVGLYQWECDEIVTGLMEVNGTLMVFTPTRTYGFDKPSPHFTVYAPNFKYGAKRGFGGHHQFEEKWTSAAVAKSMGVAHG